MSELTEEQIKDLEEMASALMTPYEISFLLQIPSQERDDFCEILKNHKMSPLFEVYNRGINKTKYELRKMTLKLAKNGSPAAEPLADKYLSELKAKVNG